MMGNKSPRYLKMRTLNATMSSGLTRQLNERIDNMQTQFKVDNVWVGVQHRIRGVVWNSLVTSVMR